KAAKWRPSLSLLTARPLLRGRQRRRLSGSRSRGLRGRLLLALGEDELVALDGDLAQPVHHGAGPGRDQAADNDVLLETVERVGLAAHRSFGEHARRLLERRRRDERAR